jgi:hypothetical protein
MKTNFTATDTQMRWMGGALAVGIVPGDIASLAVGA